MKKHFNDLSFLSFFITLLILCFFLISHFPHNVLSWDIFGYYLYLPLVFIYHDLGLKDITIINTIIETYQNTSTFYQAMPALDGAWVMKYPMGIAILYSPWFLVGHIWALFSTFPADGFSYPYQASLLYGSFVYTVLGLYFYWKSMCFLFKSSTVSTLVILIVFGTNYLVHTVFHGQGLMSHNYLFTLFSLVLWLTIKWHEKPKMKYVIGLGFVIGFAALSRPTEILVALVPVLWNIGDKQALQKKLQIVSSNWRGIMLSLVVIAIIGSLQLIYFKLFTGRFFHNSYGNNPGEGMEFFKPYIAEVLFSFRKGWLIYTPIMFFALIGFIAMFKKMRAHFYAILVFFLLSFYVIASWSCWWYADCFSQRALIPMYVFLSLPLGTLIEFIHEKWSKVFRILFSVLLIIFLLFNLFQSWQFLNGIIHTSRMTKGYYKEVFLRTTIPISATEKLIVDRTLSPEEILNSGKKFESKVLYQNDFELEGMKPDTLIVTKTIGKVFEVNSTNQFSPMYEATYDELGLEEYGILKVSVRLFPVVAMENNHFYFTATFMHKGEAYAYWAKLLLDTDLILNTWNQLDFYYLTPEVRRSSDAFRTTFWLQGQYPVYIDDMKVELFEEIK